MIFKWVPTLNWPMSILEAGYVPVKLAKGTYTGTDSVAIKHKKIRI